MLHTSTDSSCHLIFVLESNDPRSVSFILCSEFNDEYAWGINTRHLISDNVRSVTMDTSNPIWDACQIQRPNTLQGTMSYNELAWSSDPMWCWSLTLNQLRCGGVQNHRFWVLQFLPISLYIISNVLIYLNVMNIQSPVIGPMCLTKQCYLNHRLIHIKTCSPLKLNHVSKSEPLCLGQDSWLITGWCLRWFKCHLHTHINARGLIPNYHWTNEPVNPICLRKASLI